MRDGDLRLCARRSSVLVTRDSALHISRRQQLLLGGVFSTTYYYGKATRTLDMKISYVHPIYLLLVLVQMFFVCLYRTLCNSALILFYSKYTKLV